MAAVEPLLSVVVTSRNDDHGNNLLGRMQTFVYSFIEQCKRHELPAELVIVEWNPPADRPRLARALRWPDDCGPCQVRIIEVPPYLHRQFKHGDSLPLFQMIGKNVGIRRARGKFILATNIDIIFNDELMQFIVSGQLKPGRMYRMDRHDTMSEVPEDGPVEEQLDFCRTHLLRINAREGTLRLTQDGYLFPAAEDICKAEDGIRLGTGWYDVERGAKGVSRWVYNDAALYLTAPEEGPAVLHLQLERGSGIRRKRFLLEFRDAEGRIVRQGYVGRSLHDVFIAVPLAPGQTGRFTLSTPEGGHQANQIYVYNFRVHQCHWLSQAEAAERDIDPQAVRFLAVKVAEPLKPMAASLLPGFQFERGWHLEEHRKGKYHWGEHEATVLVEPPTDGIRWLFLEVEPGPPHARQPVRLTVYDNGGNELCEKVIKKRRWLRLPIFFEPGTVCRFYFIAKRIGPTPQGAGNTVHFKVNRGFWSRPSRFPWMRVIQTLDQPPHKYAKRIAATVQTCVAFARWLDQPMSKYVRMIITTMHGLTTKAVTKAQRTACAVASRAGERANKLTSRVVRLDAPAAFLHTNACGDFTLISRQHWFKLRGYPEWPIFSLHIDSVFCYMAHHGGTPETMLTEPMRIYHIEHGNGSGWTPEGAQTLLERITAKGIPVLEYQQCMTWAKEMRKTGRPLQPNKKDWGLGDTILPEWVYVGRKPQENFVTDAAEGHSEEMLLSPSGFRAR